MRISLIFYIVFSLALPQLPPHSLTPEISEEEITCIKQGKGFQMTRASPALIKIVSKTFQSPMREVFPSQVLLFQRLTVLFDLVSPALPFHGGPPLPWPYRSQNVSSLHRLSPCPGFPLSKNDTDIPFAEEEKPTELNI